MKKVFAISIAFIVLSFQIAGAQQVVNVAPGLNTLVDAIARNPPRELVPTTQSVNNKNEIIESIL